MANRRSKTALRKQETEQMYRNLFREAKHRHKAKRTAEKYAKEKNRKLALKAKPYTKFGFPDFIAGKDWFANGPGKILLSFQHRFVRHPKKFAWDHYEGTSYWGARKIHGFLVRLTKYLFVKYEMPEFMFTAFFEDNPLYIGWFFHLAEGKNLRHCQGLPFPITNKMATYFLKGSEGLTITQNLRKAQVLGFGGNQVLANTLANTHLGGGEMLKRSARKEAFYRNFILWLIQHDITDARHIDLLLWYVDVMKFRTRRVFQRNGETYLSHPPKPNMELKGRSPEKLISHAKASYAALKLNKPFPKNDIYDRIYDYSQRIHKVGTYRISPLMSSKDIAEEGREMRHCVGNYSASCQSGSTSIWSMTLERPKLGIKRLLTIAVNDKLQITEVKGYANREPHEEESIILRRWADHEGLGLRSHLR